MLHEGPTDETMKPGESRRDKILRTMRDESGCSIKGTLHIPMADTKMSFSTRVAQGYLRSLKEHGGEELLAY